jgi:hypothetical protein
MVKPTPVRSSSNRGALMTGCFTRGRTGANLTGSSVGDASDPLRGSLPSEIDLGSVALHDPPWQVTNVPGGQPLSDQFRSALESPSGVESMTGFELDARNDNTITTEALPLDNALNWCHYRNRKGGMEVTMSASIVATRCSGRRPTAGVLRDSVSPSGSSFARIHAALSLHPPSGWRVKGLTIREKGVPIR